MKSSVSLIDPATVLAPGTTATGAADLSNAAAALLTARVVNGATGPTAGVRIDVLIAHAGEAPEDGLDWKTWVTWTSGATSAERYDFAGELPHAARNVRVRMRGNTGQAVTVEALLSIVEG